MKVFEYLPAKHLQYDKAVELAGDWDIVEKHKEKVNQGLQIIFLLITKEVNRASLYKSLTISNDSIEYSPENDYVTTKFNYDDAIGNRNKS